MRSLINFIPVFILALLASLSIAQAQQQSSKAEKGFHYQAVLRHDDGRLMKEEAINLQISILKSGPDGELVFREGHTTQTDAFGMVHLQIGKGIIQNGGLAEVNWGGDEYWLDIALDLAQNSNYKQVGSSLIMSVPHAIQADLASDVSNEVKQELRDTRWLEGEGAPTSGYNKGIKGDFYLDITTAKVYSKLENGTWAYRGQLSSDNLDTGDGTRAGIDWAEAGNNLSGGEFIGSTNSAALVIKTNNAEVARFTSDGRMEIGGSGFGGAARLTIKQKTEFAYHEGLRILKYNLNSGFRLYAGGNYATLMTEGTLGFGVKNKDNWLLLQKTNGDLAVEGNIHAANQVSIIPLWQAGSNYTMSNTSGADLANCESGFDPTIYETNGDLEVRLVIRITSTSAGTNNFQLRIHDGTTQQFPILSSDSWTFASTQSGIVAVSQWKDLAAGSNAHEVHLFGWVDAGSTNFNSAYLMIRPDPDL